MTSDLTPEDEDRLKKALEGELDRKPPTIGLVGVSGVGKSSTINTMFRTHLPISHTVACTKEFTEVPLDVNFTGGPSRGEATRLIVFDAPGLGEDRDRDPDYLAMYRENLPHCDVILWLSAARNRAVALDQSYLEQFADLQDRMTFGLSQVDLVEPRNWKDGLPIPSKEQEAHIREIVADRSDRFSRTLGRRIEFVPFSATRGYHLDWLFTNVLDACTTGRKWIFQGLKNFRLEDFIASSELRERFAPQDISEPVGNGLFDRLRGLIAKQPLTGGDVLYLAKEFLDYKRGASSRDSRFEEILRQTIGRTDYKSRPLSERELRKLEDRWRREQLKRT